MTIGTLKMNVLRYCCSCKEGDREGGGMRKASLQRSTMVIKYSPTDTGTDWSSRTYVIQGFLHYLGKFGKQQQQPLDEAACVCIRQSRFQLLAYFYLVCTL